MWVLDHKEGWQSYGFSSIHIWMWEVDHNEAWVPKNWCFPVAVLRRLWRVPWTARRSTSQSQKKSTLNIHWKDWCWSWSYCTLATWREDSTHWKWPWWWERLRAGEVGDRGWDGITNSMDMNLSRLQAIVKDREAWSAAVHGVTKSQTRLSARTIATTCRI